MAHMNVHVTIYGGTNPTYDAVVYPYEADNTRFEGGVHHLAIQRYLEVDLTSF